MSGSTDKVLGSILGKAEDPEKAAANELQTEATEPEVYRPYVIRARPQMGFMVVEADGTMHGFMYHTLHHPKHQVRDGEEFLSFSSSGIAVVMQGRGLKIIFLALMRHTLVEVRAYDGRPPGELASRIERLAITDTTARPAQEPPARLVK